MTRANVAVRILRNTRVEGQQVPAMVGQKGKEKRNVIRVDEDTARLLISSGKGEYVEEAETPEPVDGRD